MTDNLTTLGSHLRAQKEIGALADVIEAIALAGKAIAHRVRRARIDDVIGEAGAVNVQGETQQKLDVLSDELLMQSLRACPAVALYASEEQDGAVVLGTRAAGAEYCVLADPLDGSSNIDVNVSIGTIFSIHRKRSRGERGVLEDCLQPGCEQVAAGYVVYGSSTMLVYTSGAGVHGFTLDPSIGEFLLSHPLMRMPDPPKKVYSINEAYYARWSRPQQRLVTHLKTEGGFGSRYIGSFVADIHRTLLQGGLFMYPADAKSPEGKLRLLYEAAPMAMVIEQAGGRASDGHRDLMSIEPEALHQRTPVYMGSKEFVDLADGYLAEGE